MSLNLTQDFNALLDGRVHLEEPLAAIHERYENAKPFRHVVLDDIFSTTLLDDLIAEMASMSKDRWMVVQQAGLEKILRMRSGTELGPAGSRLAALLHSPAFLYLLSEITGVWQLLPDPYLQGAGYASMRPGDFFNIHSDRSVAYDTGLTRRMAMIIFLNKAWKAEYNGQLELWDAEGKQREVSIDPVYNRTIIFEVAFPNYHGVPAPLACPPDRQRQSFITYFHTVGIDGKTTVKPHSSIFAPQFYRTKSTGLRGFVRAVTPPILVAAARRLIKTRG
jgi:hypothetical protein